MKKWFSPAWLIPLGLYLLAKCFMYFIAIQGNCWAGFGADCWVRWDSALYMQIAEQGHTLFFCGPEQGYEAGSTAWCGNSGWAPLYPFLMFLTHKIAGISIPTAGILLSNLFFLGYLLASAKIIDIQNFGLRNWLLMGIFAFCPGNVYFHAVFPISLVAFLITLLFIFIKKEQFLYAGIVGFFAVLSYSTGFFLLAVMGMYGIVLWLNKHPKVWQYIFKTGEIAALALLALFGYDYFATGHWNALFLIQGKYGHGIQSPWRMFGEHWKLLMARPFTLWHWSEVQNMVMIVYILGLSIFTFKKQPRPFGIFHSLFLFVFWFLPYSISLQVSLYRNAAVLGAGHSAAKELPAWLLACILAIFIGLSYPLGILFIQSVIV